MMKISQKVGGVAAGAFGPDGRLYGLIFGLTGLRDGHTTHWSHIMAVESGLRGRGLGRYLKAFQRALLLELGVRTMIWTYDPLVARNAHLNLQRLGAEPVEYHPNFYGDGGQNELHRGIGTDRFIVEWRLDGAKVEQRLRGEEDPGTEAFRSLSPVNSQPSGVPRRDEFPLPEAPRVLIEIPLDVQEVKERDGDEAMAWRLSTRRAFQHYFARGYRVRSFLRGQMAGSYALEAPRA